MVSPEGDIVLVPMEEAQLAFGDGYRLEEAASKGARGLRKEYEGVLPGAAALGVGGLKGLSFGLSTPILRGLGVDVEALETFRPGAFTGGEVGGTRTRTSGDRWLWCCRDRSSSGSQRSPISRG